LPAAARVEPGHGCQDRQASEEVGTHIGTRGAAAYCHSEETQSRDLAGTGGVAVLVLPLDTEVADAKCCVQTSWSGGQKEAVVVGDPTYARLPVVGDTVDSYVRQGVLSGVRASGNLTWAVMDSCAAQTLRD
jgi:hypothetical protein